MEKKAWKVIIELKHNFHGWNKKDKVHGKTFGSFYRGGGKVWASCEYIGAHTPLPPTDIWWQRHRKWLLLQMYVWSPTPNPQQWRGNSESGDKARARIWAFMVYTRPSTWSWAPCTHDPELRMSEIKMRRPQLLCSIPSSVQISFPVANPTHPNHLWFWLPRPPEAREFISSTSFPCSVTGWFEKLLTGLV